MCGLKPNNPSENVLADAIYLINIEMFQTLKKEYLQILRTSRKVNLLEHCIYH